MSRGITILIEFLSAGVVTSLVAGVFSLIVSIKNNKRLIELEGIKQRFVLTQERYKEIKAAYTELINELPEDKLLGHYIINLPLKENFQEYASQNIQKLLAANYEIICLHYKKYEYLFSENDKDKILKLIDDIDDSIKKQTKIIHNLISHDVGFNDEEINEIINDRILKMVELEELYYDTLKHYLNMFLT